jgi:hypothetical protein
MVQHDGSVTRPEPRARRTRWGLRAGLATVLAAWLVLGAIGGPTVGRLSGVQENDNANFLPKQAESTLMNNESAKFVGSEALPYFVVIERDSGITPADQQKATAFLADVPKISVGDGKTIGDNLATPAQLVIPSEDKRALLLTVQLNADRADNLVKDGETVLFAVADQMRNDIKRSLTPSGLKVYVTGPGGVLADFVVAFGGIDGILLGWRWAEPGHPLHLGRRRRDGLLVAAGLAVQGRTARLHEQVPGDADRMAGRCRTDRRQCCDGDPRPALPAVVPARQHQGARPGRRDRYRGGADLRDDVPACRAAGLRTPDLLADDPAGRPRARPGRGRQPQGLGPGLRSGRPHPPQGLVRQRTRPARLWSVPAHLQGRRHFPGRALPESTWT